MKAKSRIILGAIYLSGFFAAHAQFVTVKSYQKISNTAGNFTGVLDNGDIFGFPLTSIGDLNKDGITDIAVSAWPDDDGGLDRGAVWILFLDTNGTVKSHQKISDTAGNFTGILSNGDGFSAGITSLNDLNGDGIVDIAVGAPFDDDGGTDRGAVWILFLDTNGMVKSHQKISDTAGNFVGIINNGDRFGNTLANVGDLNKDGITDLAVGALWDDDGGTDRGAVWILFLDTNGTVKSHQKISATAGNFTGILSNGDGFSSTTPLNDLDGDGVMDIAVATYHDDDGGTDRGAVWILFLDTNGTVKSNQKISDTQGNFTGILDNGDEFGIRLSSLGDLNGDNINDIIVGARRDDDGGIDRGAVWIIFLDTNGTVKSHQKISNMQGNFTGLLNDFDLFGAGVTSLGDLDGNGIVDLAVGAPLDDDGGTDRGAVWILFLNYCDSISVTSTVSGQVFDSLQVVTGGIVKLREYHSQPTQMIDVDSAMIDGLGNYTFTNVPFGQYLVIAQGDTGLYPNTVPTYSDSTNHWQKARIVNVSCDSNITADIYLISFPATIGFGDIKGKVVKKGPGKVQGSGDPFGGIDVTLIKKPANTIEKYDVTDTNGIFEFKDVPIGDYELYIDIPGLPLDTTYNVSVTINDSSFVDLDFCVDSSIYTCKLNTSVFEVPVLEAARFKIYPNPYTGQAQIVFTLANKANVSLEAYNILGENIQTLVKGIKPKGDYQYTFSANKLGYPSGIYLLKLVVDDKVYTQRLVEIH